MACDGRGNGCGTVLAVQRSPRFASQWFAWHPRFKSAQKVGGHTLTYGMGLTKLTVKMIFFYVGSILFFGPTPQTVILRGVKRSRRI